MIQIFKGIFAIVLALTLIILFFYLLDKFFGISVTSKHSSQQRKSLDRINEFSKEEFIRENQLNPNIVNQAKNRVKNKHYSMTYSNVVDEIDKIKKKESLEINSEISKPFKQFNIKKNTNDPQLAFHKDKLQYLKDKNIEFYRLYRRMMVLKSKIEYTDEENTMRYTSEFKSWCNSYSKSESYVKFQKLNNII